MQDFELSFSDFIDGEEYEQAQNAMFYLVRKAFKAGWLAAEGEPPKPATATQLFGTKYGSPPDGGDIKGFAECE